MTRTARRATSLIAFSLLTSAATAHAECAWVLWRDIFSLDRDGVPIKGAQSVATPLEGMATKVDCQQTLRQRTKEWTNQGATTRGATNTSAIVELRDANGTTRFSFRCLPDTVDPRGPKGK